MAPYDSPASQRDSRITSPRQVRVSAANEDAARGVWLFCIPEPQRGGGKATRLPPSHCDCVRSANPSRLFIAAQRLRLVLGFPDLGQELPRVFLRRLADLGEHAGEIALRIGAVRTALAMRLANRACWAAAAFVPAKSQMV